jgi:hypothetical protein
LVNGKLLTAVDPAKLMSMSLDLRRLAEALLPPPRVPAVDARVIRQILWARRERDRHFGGGLFADPAWDMLLDLFAARLEARQVSVSSLCTAAAVPPTTALRWIGMLCSEGLIHRSADRGDGRRILVDLTDDAVDRMSGYFTVVRQRADLKA